MLQKLLNLFHVNKEFPHEAEQSFLNGLGFLIESTQDIPNIRRTSYVDVYRATLTVYVTHCAITRRETYIHTSVWPNIGSWGYL